MINLAFELKGLPATVLISSANTNKKTFQIGPVLLNEITRRSKGVGMTTKYTTNTMLKAAVKLTGDDRLDPELISNTETDKCAADWAKLEIVGRCFGLKTHTDYLQYKNISIVRDAQHCKSLCCAMGNKCISWQYWIDIKMCKLGDSVRIGSEYADTALWCDVEPPIVWEGEKLHRLPTGELTPGAPIVPVSTQCFGLGAEQMKQLPPDAQGVIKSVPLSVKECRAACLAQKDCHVWQAHERRGCYYNKVSDSFCEPYKGRYTGGRRKCNDKCLKVV
jgi:hypothetical protein